MKILLKRAYDEAAPSDGFRVLVDALWPRGRSHENFHYDVWERDIAPSTELRHWFHADPEGRYDEFARRYKAELKANPRFSEFVKMLESHPVVTFLYGSHDTAENNATVLREAVLKAVD